MQIIKNIEIFYLDTFSICEKFNKIQNKKIFEDEECIFSKENIIGLMCIKDSIRIGKLFDTTFDGDFTIECSKEEYNKIKNSKKFNCFFKSYEFSPTISGNIPIKSFKSKLKIKII